MQILITHRQLAGRYTDKLDSAIVHLEFMRNIHEFQHEAGRFHIYEHPRSAASCYEARRSNTQATTQAEMVIAAMCRFGMTTTVGGTERFAQETTRVMTNSHFAAEYQTWDVGTSAETNTPWAYTMEGPRARQGHIYPKKFRRASCQGTNEQRGFDKSNLMTVLEVEHGRGVNMLNNSMV